jgi:hypothetical protein
MSLFLPLEPIADGMRKQPVLSKRQCHIRIRRGAAFAFVFPFVFTTSVQSFAQSANDSPFRPRTDVNAMQDTIELRERLSRMSDSRGPLDPLGAFLRQAETDSATVSNSTSKSGLTEPERMADRKSLRDPESERKPGFESPPRDYRSFDSPSDLKASAGLRLLPGPRYTIVQDATSVPSNLVAADNFRPVRTVSTFDVESTTRPTLQSPVSLASSNGVPYYYDPNNVIARYQGPELPGGNGGIPPQGPVPGLPPAFATQPPLTNPSNAFIPPPTFSGPAPGGFVSPAIPSAQPTTMLPVYPTQPPTNILPPTNSPAVMPNYPPAGSSVPLVGNPIQNGQPSSIVQPGPTYVAPPTYYPNNVPPQAQAPTVSPSDAAMPRYPRPPNIVNNQPFVSAPSKPFDACYMVSPSVYRQAYSNPCDAPNAGNSYTGGPNSGRTSSPFSYVPPTYMASNLYRSPPYPILVGFGQDLNGAYFSRGIVGQPKAYLDGQPIRNFLRYLTP